ncbi:hypothetical protein [Caenimonas koreensis]|uniref:hypothetical protein n=1 Tax=Caenimonas koreensis TaxID=367474 RepID=UPI0037834A45
MQAPLAPSALAPSVTREAATVSRAGSAVIDDNWAEAMVQARGRSVRLQRAQADRLPALLNAVVRGPAAPPSVADLQPSLTIELTGPGSADTVEILGAQVRYTRLRDGQPKAVTVLTPNAAQLQALQAEADRLLGR